MRNKGDSRHPQRLRLLHSDFRGLSRYINFLIGHRISKLPVDGKRKSKWIYPARELPQTRKKSRRNVTVKPGFDLTPTKGEFNTQPFENTTINGSRPSPTDNTPVVGSMIAPKIMTKERVLAIAMFDINACDFEEQVQAFLEHHVNHCHSYATEATSASS